MLVALIFFYIACACAIALTLFPEKGSISYYVTNFVATFVILALGLLSASYNNDFGGYTILLVIAMVPLLFANIDLKTTVAKPKESEEEKNESAVFAQETVSETEEDNSETTDKKPKKKKPKFDLVAIYKESNGKIYVSLLITITVLLIALAGMYLGQENAYGYLLGIPAGIIGFCVFKIKKQKNFLDLTASALLCFCIGVLFGQILNIFAYVIISISSILYAVGSLVLIGYIIAKMCTENKFVNLILFASLLIFTISLLFL